MLAEVLRQCWFMARVVLGRVPLKCRELTLLLLWLTTAFQLRLQILETLVYQLIQLRVAQPLRKQLALQRLRLLHSLVECPQLLIRFQIFPVCRWLLGLQCTSLSLLLLLLLWISNGRRLLFIVNHVPELVIFPGWGLVQGYRQLHRLKHQLLLPWSSSNKLHRLLLLRHNHCRLRLPALYTFLGNDLFGLDWWLQCN
jgi:hypothetical protein